MAAHTNELHATITTRVRAPSVDHLTQLRGRITNLLTTSPCELVAISQAADTTTYNVIGVNTKTGERFSQVVQATTTDEATEQVETDTMVITTIEPQPATTQPDPANEEPTDATSEETSRQKTGSEAANNEQAS